MAVMPFGMPGIYELLLIALMSSGVGVPLGVPPQDPDPFMTKIAPEQCIYFATWAGMAEPDAKSANETERLLAEPEVRAFAAELERAATQIGQQIAANAPNQEMGMLVAAAPVIAKALITRPTSIMVESLTAIENGFDAKGAVVVKLGDDPDHVYDALTRFLKTAPPSVARNVVIEGVDCIALQVEAKVPQLTVGLKDEYLIVAIGEGSFREVLQRSTTKQPAWLSEAMQELPVPRMSSFAYADLEAIVKLTGPMGGPDVQQLLKTMGVTSLRSAISVSGLDETGFVSRAKVTSADPDKGIGALVSAQPLTRDDLVGIPADASIALALRMDLGQVLDEGLKMLAQFEPDNAEDVRLGFDQMGRAFGIDFEDDLLASLGDVWTLHTAPSSGGLVAGWTLTVDLADAQKARDTHRQVLRVANAMFAQQQFRVPKIRQFEHGELTAYTLEIPQPEFVFAPTWCLTDNQLVVTMLPQAMKSYLNQLGAGRSLVDMPAVAEVLGQEQGPCSLSYHDVRSHFVAFYPFLQFGAQSLAHEAQRDGFDVNISALPSIRSVAPHLMPTVSSASKVEDGFESYAHSTLPGVNLGATAPVLASTMVPAIVKMRQAQQRMKSTNNLKQIALAMHNYHDVFKGFPAAHNTDEEGKPLLSWRVLVLPFLEQQALYDEFHLDEPWNSEHNRKLIARMPEVYRSPSSKADPGKTTYLGNAGKDGIFIAPREKKTRGAIGVRMRDIRDGTSNTVMVVEASDPAAVIWTKPDDFELDDKDPRRGLVGVHPGFLLAAFCDGSVQNIRLNLDADTLKALFSRAGGEPVSNWR